MSKAGGVQRRDAFLDKERPGSLEYRVVAQAWGYRKQRTEWRPLPEGPAAGDITVGLEPDELSTLLAMVRNADGTPFQGMVDVSLRDDDVEFGFAGSGLTDAFGRCQVVKLPSGDLHAHLRARPTEGQGAWQMPVETSAQRVSLPPGGTGEAEFEIPATGEIRINWMDSGGSAIRGSYTKVEFAGHNTGVSSQVTRIVGLPQGPAILTLSARGYKEWKATVQVVVGTPATVDARMESQ